VTAGAKACIPPPTVGDLIGRARCDGFPRVRAGEREFGPGAHVWRTQLEALTDAERLRVWQADWTIVVPSIARPAPKTIAPRAREATAAQLRALADALAKWHGLERWSCFAPQPPLPPFSVRWIDPAAPEPGFPIDRAEALVAYFADADPVLALRLDSAPDVLHRTCLHELQHLVDEPLFRAGWSIDVLEQRARETAARLAGL
jgi:hypothetical protein